MTALFAGVTTGEAMLEGLAWDNMVDALNVGHESSGLHKSTLFNNTVPLTNPHVMDVLPATCVSYLQAGTDLAFRCGTTTAAMIYFDWVELHKNMAVSAGLTFIVSFQCANAPAAKKIGLTAAGFRWRNNAAMATLTPVAACITTSSGAGLSMAIPISSGSVADGDVLAISVKRDPAAANDTYPGDVYVLSGQLQYTYQEA